jgi:hypothetical protein
MLKRIDGFLRMRPATKRFPHQQEVDVSSLVLAFIMPIVECIYVVDFF